MTLKPEQMIRRCAGVLLLAVVATAGWVGHAVATPTSPTSAGGCTHSSTIQLIGNQIQDTCGTTIVARGPEMVVADGRLTSAIDSMAGMGANSLRMLLTLDAANGMTPATFDSILARAVSHDMIVWLSLYAWDDTNSYLIAPALGGGNLYSLTAPSGTGTCAISTPTSCYLAVWSRQWLKDLVAKYKGHVVIDAMQEYVGDKTIDRSTEAGRTEWADAAKVNVQWFRSAGYTVPLEIMSNFQGRDLYAIVEKGASIRAVDTDVVGADPQTMFGWQGYWADAWYKGYQGNLLLGGSNTITAVQAIHQFAVTQSFPIEIGVDNYPGDSGSEYKAELDQAATDNASWLWWSWNNNPSIECPNDGATCVTYVTTSQSGFAGAVRSQSGKPTGATATAGNGSALVSWTAPADNGGSPITGYTVTSSGDAKTCTTSATSCTVSGLTSGQPYTFTVTATNAAGTGPASDPSSSVTVSLIGATYHALTPARVLDSRDGYWIGLSGAFSSHVARTFTVIGHGGVPSNATAVTGNLTVTGQTALGYLSVGPNAMNNPTSSTLNFPLGDDRANAVTVALGAGGTLSVTYVAVPGATAQVIFDVTGYFTPDSTGATYVAVTPARVLDSRDVYWIGLSGASSSHVARTFTVSGHGGVPSNAIAVTGNMGAGGQTALGYLYIGPNAMNNPTSSTLNFPLGDDPANAVTVALGAGGTLSVTYVAVPGATAQVIFDVTGYFVP